MNTATDEYALIEFNGLCLLLSQAAVAAIDLVSNIKPGRVALPAIGVLDAGVGEWPVFALGGEFEALDHCPPDYRACVAIDCGDGAVFALACEEVGKIAMTAAQAAAPLRDCMRLPQNPVASLLLRNNRLLLVCEAEDLRRFLQMEPAA